MLTPVYIEVTVTLAGIIQYCGWFKHGI